LGRLQEIKEDWLQEKETYQFRQLAIEPEDVEWLIEQAELLQKIGNRWIEIETELRKKQIIFTHLFKKHSHQNQINVVFRTNHEPGVEERSTR
jgi:hypothetical protein